MNSQESIGKWFKILEGKGEYVHFTVIEKQKDGQLFERDFFHGDMDGIGSYFAMMKERGETSFLLPELPKRNPPHAIVYAINFLRYLMRLPFYSPGWKIKEEWNGNNEKPRARAWISLSKEDTEKIWANAKKHGVGRNAYILYHLDLAVAPYLKKSFLPRYWLIPVNLRTDFENKKGNYTGFVDGRITNKTDIQTLDKNLKKSLLRGEALGGFVGVSIGRFIGPYFLRVLVFLNDFIQTRTGVLTNLGNWKTAPGTAMNSYWFGFPPVIKAQPFGAMTGSLNGEQSLTVVFHPSLTRSEDLAKECLDRWVRLLIQG